MNRIFGLLVGVSLLLSGCAVLPREEIAYQVVSAVDFATTINIAKRPDCYREVGFPTAEIIGEHPSVGAVAGWWAVQAIGHAAISHWLKQKSDEQSWRAVYRGWQTVTIGYSAYNVAHNYEIGLRPFGSGCHAH